MRSSFFARDSRGKGTPFGARDPLTLKRGGKIVDTSWNSKGCATCREQWEAGRPPPELAVNYELHGRLHRCRSCGAYWEQSERYADVLTEDAAKQRYPGAFNAALAP